MRSLIWEDIWVLGVIKRSLAEATVMHEVWLMYTNKELLSDSWIKQEVLQLNLI